MGCVATDWGRFDRIDLHPVESISLLRQVFFLFESCSKIRRSEEGLRCFWGRSRDSISFDALLFRFVTKG